MGAWVIGHNIAGYLPESDTFAFETREEAVAEFRTMAEGYADENDEGTEAENQDMYDSEEDVPEDEQPMMRALVDAILEDDGPDAPDLAGKDYSLVVVDGNGRHVVFWLAWSDDRAPYTDELGLALD